MKRSLGWTIVNRLEEGVTFFFFVVMCVFVFLQVFFRFVLNHPLLYPEEVARAAYVWLSFIGMSLISRTREQIRVDFFVQLLPIVPRRWVQLVVDLLILVMMVALGWFGLRFVIFSRMSITPALEVPMNLYYVAFPLGCLLSIFRLAQHIVADLAEARGQGPTVRADRG